MIDTCKILKEAKSIAVVGFSKNKSKTSRQIAMFLKSVGYQIFAVNPTIDEMEIEGVPVFKSLLEIKQRIDIVNVFRRSEDIPEIIEDVLAIKPKVLWLQLGIWNDAAVKPVKDSNITVIQDTCIYVEYNNC
ncbi:MAG: CoA-binding protein [Ignavibacteriales bacterium CG_4_9_14_3_um_filter_34_10]|nr:MAG: CoA-binding protein [Ignavibacteria bacterium CG08_land_8_20_14_0_20_37_9]PJA96002.1 MAG: CoA-binding protein [Ignavibacteriales bacterium CG_4_9_14_3_um_filter_34_10]